MTDKGSRSLPFETPHAEIRRLLAENARLRQLLIAHGIPIPPLGPEARPADDQSPSGTLSHVPIATACVAAKKEETRENNEEARSRPTTARSIGQQIVLFRSLFRGRDDVYARRWQSADGRSGYMPASLKDWNAINRSRPEDRKKVDQATRTLLPLDDAVIESHLSGRETIGVYPLLPDENCYFLAIDFDKKTWMDDARAFLATCQELNVPAAMERSRSGNGAHVWIFFDRALPASIARKLGCLLLTRTMERRHQLGLDSYDRLFPNQDTMPKGGFGNLIALPLQFRPSQVGNSVFIDGDLHPYPDQWQSSPPSRGCRSVLLKSSSPTHSVRAPSSASGSA